MATQKAVPVKAAATTAAASTTTTTRKLWIKRTPIEVVLEQIGKQEQRVAGMRADLTREERELSKLQQAKKVLEAQ